MTRRIAVISGGLREPSSTSLLAERLVEATRRALRERGETAEVTVVEVRHHGAGILQAMTSFPPADLRAATDSIAAADGVIALSPIHNASYAGLFKSFIDVLPEGLLRGMPVLLGATGGTARHSLAIDFALRPLFAHLRAEVLPTAVFAATADWGATADDVRPLPERIERAAAEFAAVLAGRPARTPVDEFAPAADFSDLLARVRGSADLQGGHQPASPEQLDPEGRRADPSSVVHRDARFRPRVIDGGDPDRAHPHPR
ncbi:MAG: NADPH-dependent FMN reductase [Actinomycetales bacterium]|nr:NADPH-dependent FMN reductase [Actinomycetales bacterium]